MVWPFLFLHIFLYCIRPGRPFCPHGSPSAMLLPHWITPLSLKTPGFPPVPWFCMCHSVLGVSSISTIRQIPTHPSKLWPYAQPPACPRSTQYKPLITTLSPLDRIFIRVESSASSPVLGTCQVLRKCLLKGSINVQL